MIKTKRPDDFPLISLLFVYFEHFLSQKPDNGIKTWKLTGLYSITIQREATHIQALINTRSRTHWFQCQDARENTRIQWTNILEGCPILRQIYVQHCIVLYPHNNRLTIHYN